MSKLNVKNKRQKVNGKRLREHIKGGKSVLENSKNS